MMTADFVVGSDASDMFISAGHSSYARKLMKKYLVGEAMRGTMHSKHISQIGKYNHGFRIVIMVSLFVMLSAVLIYLFRTKN